MPKKDCILMDVDGVLLDLVPAIAKYVLSKFNKHITPNMFTSWDWDYCLGVPLVSNELWDFVWNQELSPYPKAVSFITTLKGMGFKIIAVSQRSTRAAVANAKKHFPMFEFDYYILCNNSNDKLYYAREIDAHWALEDNPKTAADLGRNKPDLTSYLLDRPWNHHAIPITGDYKRVYDYEEFLKVLIHYLGWENVR